MYNINRMIICGKWKIRGIYMKKSKVCKYCGEKLEITSDRCLACGKTQKNFIKRNPVFIGFIIILILILISIGIILININSKSKNNDSS